MTRRLATMFLVMMFLVGISSPTVRAQDTNPDNASLKGISALSVLIESLSDGAKKMGLTKETIQTDVELKLRLAGIGVVTREESFKLPGMPELYVVVNLTDSAKASCISVELKQNVLLQRNGQPAVYVTTWDTGQVSLNLNAQDIRDQIKDKVDEFVNVWLSVNPKK